jgi:hypothetical protein
VPLVGASSPLIIVTFFPEPPMNYRQLLNELQKLPESDLDKIVTVYDYETDTILECSSPGFEICKVDIKDYGQNYPFITLN